MCFLRGGACITYAANSFIKIAPATADRGDTDSQSRPKCVQRSNIYAMLSKSCARQTQRFTEFWYSQNSIGGTLVFVKDTSFFPFLYLPFTNREIPERRAPSEAMREAERSEASAQIAELQCKHNMSIFVTSLSKHGHGQNTR